ncbi:type IV pilin protein [Metabacillus indicus]|uniref:type IV pilin protein n=1 Tax=Metabacillus TaxID=2675233 RepID=UPI00193ACC24|nr:prepilin-type N-terminal cleavage/methylation domain-containing protein [Metabacillus sp. cB07]
MFKKMLKNERGLTLIELLAVVVILGIIAAIAVPAIGNVIQKSKEDAVHAEAISVLEAAKLYDSTNGSTSGVTYTNTNQGTNPSTALNDNLNGVGQYSITMAVTNGKYTYTNIKVTKNNITKTYATEAKLRANDTSQ